jgi:mRNA-degrading endonuclease RelE of RelBE toxin-antitoxin system
VAAIERFAETGEGNVIRVQNVWPPQLRLRKGVWRARLRKHKEHRVIEVIHIRHRSQAYSPRREKK